LPSFIISLTIVHTVRGNQKGRWDFRRATPDEQTSTKSHFPEIIPPVQTNICFGEHFWNSQKSSQMRLNELIFVHENWNTLSWSVGIFYVLHHVTNITI
jgi:hypothetical protein